MGQRQPTNTSQSIDQNRKLAFDIIRQILGERMELGQSTREQHTHTTTIVSPQLPDAVVFPKTTEEVSEVVKVCARFRVPVIGFGTGTSLEGHVNAPQGGISVDFSLMNKVLAVHTDDLDCEVQPGVTRKSLNEELRSTGLFFAIDPGADASLGGMAATRASGTNAVRYGTMRENVIALKVVMADGSVVSTGQRVRKSAAGYDLTRLLVGSEGTLGLITELTLRLHGIPEAISSASCRFPTVRDACQAVINTIQFGIPVARIELLDELSVRAINAYSNLTLPENPLLLIEFHGSKAFVEEQARDCGEICTDCGGSQFMWSANPEARKQLWQARHDAYWATLKLRPGATCITTDACVPISRLADCVVAAQDKSRSLGITAPIVGHAGDGNFHMTLLIDSHNNSEHEKAANFIGWLAEQAIQMGGTCTGEHGIGQGKMPYLKRELASATHWMARIKQALDPLNIMNPGKIIDVD